MNRIFLVCILALLWCACGENSGNSTPTAAAKELLALHGLVGRLPSERSEKQKETEVERDDLERLFTDLDEFDKFTSDLFVGVVVGALAHHQAHLLEARKGKTATLTAGTLVIHLDRVNNGWKINLDRTIPQALKTKAKDEKKRYENARAAGKAAMGEMN